MSQIYHVEHDYRHSSLYIINCLISYQITEDRVWINGRARNSNIANSLNRKLSVTSSRLPISHRNKTFVSMIGEEFLIKSNSETRPLHKNDSAPWCWLISYWSNYIKILLHTI
jgi:hypothetical protein